MRTILQNSSNYLILINSYMLTILQNSSNYLILLNSYMLTILHNSSNMSFKQAARANQKGSCLAELSPLLNFILLNFILRHLSNIYLSNTQAAPANHPELIFSFASVKVHSHEPCIPCILWIPCKWCAVWRRRRWRSWKSRR